MNKKTLQLTRVFAALGDGTRLSIVKTLMRGERNVTGLCNRLTLAQPTASHHLGILLDRGIVTVRREGRCMFYRLAPKGLDGALAFLCTAVGD